MAISALRFRPLMRFGGSNPAEVIGEFSCTGSASYTTGGDAFTPANVGLSSISQFIGNNVNDGTDSRHLSYDTANGKLMTKDEDGTEETSSTDLSALTFKALVVGTLASP